VLSPFSSCKTTPEVVIYALTKWRTHKQKEKKKKIGGGKWGEEAT